MGKRSTWFSTVKKACRSPSKDNVKTAPRDLDLVGDLPPIEAKSKNKKRWSFGKSSYQPSATVDFKEQSAEKKEENRKQISEKPSDPAIFTSRKASTTVCSLTALSKITSPDVWAAIKIQTAFRAYLVHNTTLVFIQLSSIRILSEGALGY